MTLFSTYPLICQFFSLSWLNIKNVLRISIVKIESSFWAGRHSMKTRKPSASILEIFLKISIILTELVENYLLWNKSWKYLEMISTTFSQEIKFRNRNILMRHKFISSCSQQRTGPLSL